jgi:hypothetical protein
MIEWKSIREAARQALPQHEAVAAWKHAQVSFVEQDGVQQLPKDRGAEQGDVDGPLECSLSLGLVARAARLSIGQQQRLGALPWATDDESRGGLARADFDKREQLGSDFDAAVAAEGGARIDPRHEVQVDGGLVDFWYLDDGDILCHPRLVFPYLAAFDGANPHIGGERNKTKTICLAFDEELANNNAGLGLHVAGIGGEYDLGCRDRA